MRQKITPTSIEKVMREDDFIVSKTDTKGIITYCNEIFIEFAKYSNRELLGQNHNIIRHPDMPRTIYKLLWETIKSDKEINAYVKNMASDGSYYWVIANITPVKNENGKIVGYYSVRRKPNRTILDKTIIPFYQKLLEEEKKNNLGNQMEASGKILNNLLNEKGMTYEEFILSL
ncbi:MAG: PAS domain-containing protein [Bacteroidetes bacterium]|nr:PAS domain-containing protein [Bacteroidota bacterium]MBU1113668.1 PAS domain-containing protein [Bacteroidota bacterium]MBU1796746.1 PAS domain-containing protein [Bacteroidota bacterium]